MDILEKLANDQNLTQEESFNAFQTIMQGSWKDVKIGAFLMALRMKGETVIEITEAVRAIRGSAENIMPLFGAIDVCGTGGDNLGTLNISTAVAFVVAGCGIPVAKHGNKAVSSKSGSADVLSELGVKVDPNNMLIDTSLRQARLCFMMAPKFHAAMRHVAPVRAEMGIRTIFNLLGPLCNPANTRSQLMGVYDKKWVRPIAEVLKSLDSESAWVVHGSDGLDELTTTGVSYVAELKNGEIREFEVTPEEAGLARTTIEDLRGGDAPYNAARLMVLLEGRNDAYRDIVLLNAAAALIVAGKAENLRAGVAVAAHAIDNGDAMRVLENLKRITNI